MLAKLTTPCDSSSRRLSGCSRSDADGPGIVGETGGCRKGKGPRRHEECLVPRFNAAVGPDPILVAIGDLLRNIDDIIVD